MLTNPLVFMTVLGLGAGQLFPAGLPAPLAALAKQVAAAGPFLGFLTLGFALAALGHTSPAELGLAAFLCAAKLVLMPVLYVALAPRLGSPIDATFLAFLGSLPASASVYSLCLTKQLSPAIVGPLVPASMLASVALSLLPLWSHADTLHATAVLQALIGLVGLVGMRSAVRAGSSAVRVGSSFTSHDKQS